jgi:uncharacterized metal-binding protein
LKTFNSKRGEAVINNSLLAAARSRGGAAGPRCCGRGFFAYFLFPKKVRENAVCFIFFLLNLLRNHPDSWILILDTKYLIQKKMENLNQNKCSCNSGEYIVISCSGASDVGYLSDLIARKLRDNNQRSMKCLALVGADDQPVINSLNKGNVLVIDGCPQECGKKILDKASVSNYQYVRLDNWGYKKGQSEANTERVNELYKKVVLNY